MPAAIISASSRRYADAAFAVAREAGDYDAWLAAFEQVGQLLRQPSAQAVLTSPAVTPSQKRTVLDRLVPGLPRLVANFLHILAERDRLEQLPEIAEAFRELVDRERGIVTAEVTTAVPLDAELQRTVAQRLGAYFRRDPSRVVIRSRVDPSVIGGVVAVVGDILIDDSVRGRIERLRRRLIAGVV